MPHPITITCTAATYTSKKSSNTDFVELDEDQVKSGQMCYQSGGAFYESASGNGHGPDLEEILAKSLQYFGTDVAPWPTSRHRNDKDLEACRVADRASEDAALPVSLFLTSQLEEISGSSVAVPVVTSPSNTRRSRRLSLTKVNEELRSLDGRLCYERLEPVPIVAPSPLRTHVIEKQKKTNGHSHAEAPSHGRIHNLFSFIYSRSASAKKTSSVPPVDDFKVFFDSSPSYFNPGVLEPFSSLRCSTTASSSSAKTERSIRFENEVKVCETFAKDDYSRESVEYVARQLTPALALAIKKELNTIKQEMEVHEESRENTQFYFIK